MAKRFPWDGQDGQGSKGGAGGRPITEFLSEAQFLRLMRANGVSDYMAAIMYTGGGGGSKRGELDDEAKSFLEAKYGPA